MRTALWLLALQLCASISLTAPATFGLTNIWTVELRATPDSWNTILGSRTFTPVDSKVNRTCRLLRHRHTT